MSNKIPEEAIKYLRNTHIIWKDVSEKQLIEKALNIAFDEGKKSASQSEQTLPDKGAEEGSAEDAKSVLRSFVKNGWLTEEIAIQAMQSYASTQSAEIQRVESENKSLRDEVERLEGIIRKQFEQNCKYSDVIIKAMWPDFCKEHNLTPNNNTAP